jgi:hypothetical protein
VERDCADPHLLTSQGYLLNEVPCNMILSRSRPSLFLPTIMFCWVGRTTMLLVLATAHAVQGAMSIGAKGVNSLGGMVAFRVRDFCSGIRSSI